jgi:opacity protein-like surface antigen
VATPAPGGVITPGLTQPPNMFVPFPSASYVVATTYAPVPFVSALSPFAIDGVAHEDDDTSWSAVLGYRISNYIAAEINYVTLGKLTAQDTFYVYPTFAPLQSKYTLETRGPTLTLLGILPVRETWDIYVRAGAFFVDSKLQSVFGASNRSTTFGSEGFVYGFGTQYNLGKHWSLRLDLQRYNKIGEKLSTGEADIDSTTFGVLYRL